MLLTRATRAYELLARTQQVSGALHKQFFQLQKLKYICSIVSSRLVFDFYKLENCGMQITAEIDTFLTHTFYQLSLSSHTVLALAENFRSQKLRKGQFLRSHVQIFFRK